MFLVLLWSGAAASTASIPGITIPGGSPTWRRRAVDESDCNFKYSSSPTNPLANHLPIPSAVVLVLWTYDIVLATATAAAGIHPIPIPIPQMVTFPISVSKFAFPLSLTQFPFAFAQISFPLFFLFAFSLPLSLSFSFAFPLTFPLMLAWRWALIFFVLVVFAARAIIIETSIVLGGRRGGFVLIVLAGALVFVVLGRRAGNPGRWFQQVILATGRWRQGTLRVMSAGRRPWAASGQTMSARCHFAASHRRGWGFSFAATTGCIDGRPGPPWGFGWSFSDVFRGRRTARLLMLSRPNGNGFDLKRGSGWDSSYTYTSGLALRLDIFFELATRS